MKNRILIFFILNFFCQLSFSQFTNTDIVGKLKVDTNDNVSKIVATASNTTDVYFSLRYVFSVIYYDSNNDTSKESQENLFSIDPNQTIKLYETSLTLEGDNKVIVLLLIYDEDDKLVAKDRFVFNDTEEQEVEEKPNDGIELLGLLADETKTKFGKDFYDFFYFYFNYYNIKSSKIVKVEEVVSFRRNTQIKVTIDDNVIFTFFSKPDTEFLEEMSKVALQRVYKHLQNLKKENAYITQY